MHRRARHFKPKSVSASLGFDSRYITGLSNGSAVSTWSDRSGNANDATQATSGNQPSYATNVLGGCPGVRFNGSTNYLESGSFISLSALTEIACVDVETNTSPRIIFYQGNFISYSPLYNWIGMGAFGSPRKWNIGNYDDGNEGSVGSTSSPIVGGQQISGIVNDSGTNRVYFNGLEENTSTSQPINLSSSSRPTLGRPGLGNVDYFSGSILSLLLTNYAMGSSLLKRIQHSNGFSFKIACS